MHSHSTRVAPIEWQGGVGHAEDSIEELGRVLLAAPRPAQMVAIDGHSAARKTALDEQFVERLDATRVQGDDFHRVHDPDVRTALGPADGARRYYDRERMLVEALAPLRSGGRRRPSSRTTGTGTD